MSNEASVDVNACGANREIAGQLKGKDAKARSDIEDRPLRLHGKHANYLAPGTV